VFQVAKLGEKPLKGNDDFNQILLTNKLNRFSDKLFAKNIEQNAV